MKIYVLLLVFLSLLSCNKWLTIDPQGQVDATKLLTTQNGYNSALGGVYYTLSSETMYGANMTYGLIDAMAQYWNISENTSHTFYSLSNFKYKASDATSRINSIWKEYYSCIAQCNLIIASLNENRAKIKYAELIEGEAYGLRAFCHMELFKLFGPVIKTKADLEKKSIAYRTRFDVISLEFMSGTVVLENATQDLNRAMDLMKNDPINIAGRRGDMNTSGLNHNATLKYRGARMNYYAALAMMARVEQLRLEQDEAFKYATRLIKECEDSKVFKLIDKANIQADMDLTKDLNYSREMIFSIYVDELWEQTDLFFGMNGKSVSTNSGVLINPDLYLQLKDDLYFRAPDGSSTDNRYRYWIAEKNNSIGNYNMCKLISAQKLGTAPAYYPEIGIFRISEAYYIACEALIGKDNEKALEYLNTVRRTRNLIDISAPVSNEMLEEYLLREQRKDNIGDGLMFSIYKRHFAPIYVSHKLTIAPLESNFVWPIPDSEYEFSPNIKPTE